MGRLGADRNLTLKPFGNLLCEKLPTKNQNATEDTEKIRSIPKKEGKSKIKLSKKALPCYLQGRNRLFSERFCNPFSHEWSKSISY